MRARRVGFRQFVLGLVGFSSLVTLITCVGGGPGADGVAGVTSALTPFDDLNRTAPGALIKVGTNSGGASNFVQLVRLTATRFVSAVTAGSHLKLILWELADDGTITRLSEVSDVPGITELAVARASDSAIVVAAQTTDGNLRVTSWKIADTTMSLVREQASVPASQVSVTLVSSAEAIAGTAYQVAVGFRASTGALTINTYRLDADANMIQTNHAVGSVATKVALTSPSRPFGIVTSGIRNADGVLEVTAWSVDTAGRITRRGWQKGQAITDVKAAPSSYRRIGLAEVTATATYVSTWDLSGAGSTLDITQHDSNSWGNERGPAALSSVGGTRLMTLVKTPGLLTLRSWEALDKLAPLDVTTRSSSISTDATPVAAISLAPDRTVIGFTESTGNFRIVAYRDFDMPLIRGEWHSSLTKSPPATPPPTPTTFGFQPGLGSTDASVAAGRSVVTFVDKGSIAMFDKTRLGAGLANVPTKVSVKTVLASVMAELNRHVEEWCDPEQPVSDNSGSSAVSALMPNQCIQEIYDSRIAYDDVTQRFVILAGLRWRKAIAIHYFGFAVSKTADPRDGFYTYASTESKIADWPRIAVGGGMLVVSHNDSGVSSLDAGSYFFDMSALANPVLAASDSVGPDGTVTHTEVLRRVPVSKLSVSAAGGLFKSTLQYGAQPGAFLYQRSSAGITLLELQKPWGAPLTSGGSPTVAPMSVKASLVLPNPGVQSIISDPSLTMTGPSAVDGRYAGQFLVGSTVSGGAGQRDVLVSQFQVDQLANQSLVGSVLHSVKVSCLGRATSPITCDYPAAAQAKNGGVVVGYMRGSTTTAGSVFPSAEYQAFDASFTFGASGVLQAGNSQPLDSSGNPIVDMDFASAVPDPVDNAVWFAHNYTQRAGDFGMAGGRVMR